MKGFLKGQSGIVATDGIIALLIITLFTGIIATVSYNIYISSASTKRMGQATQYLTSIFETVDAMEYNNVSQNSVNQVITDLSAPAGYTITSNVQNYTVGGNQPTADLIKIIDTDITYKVGNEEETIGANHIKARETY